MCLGRRLRQWFSVPGLWPGRGRPSEATPTPALIRVRSCSAADGRSAMAALSVISMLSIEVGIPRRCRAAWISDTRLPAASCRGEMFTEIALGVPASDHCRAWVQASSMTQRPIAWISPLCSATWMNSSRETLPSSGSCQRGERGTAANPTPISYETIRRTALTAVAWAGRRVAGGGICSRAGR